ncbi:MAG: FxSxx-COOH system tetratricopeptide repeat protein [Actinoplanes sp.]
MPIGLPGPEKVLDAPTRALVEELHGLYGFAGRPAARAISRRVFGDKELDPVSHETVSALLRGASVPAWSKVESIIIVLNRMSVRQTDEGELRLRFNRLWIAVERPPRGATHERRPAPARSRPEVSTPPPVERRSTPPDGLRIRGDLPERSPSFTGREILLARMARRQADNPAAPLVLHGPLGAGKTQLAREYVRLYADDYSVVWWVDAADPERAGTSLIALAERIGVSAGADPRQVFGALESASLSYLIVFDGAETDIRSLIRTVGGNVIVTTRNAGWAQENANLNVEVRDLDRGEALQLLRKRDPQLDPARADRLIGQVGRSPLALEQVLAMRESLPGSWEDLTDRLGDPGGALLSEAPALPGQYPVTVAEAVRNALDRLAELDRTAAALITVLAGFGPAPVSVPMLLAGASGGVSADLRRGLGDQVELRKRWPLIIRCGLARLEHEDRVERIVLPAIVRLALREIVPEAQREQARADVREILTAADPGRPDDPATWHLHRAIAPHVRPAGLIGWDRLPAYRTIRHQVRFLFLSGRYAEAQRLGRDAESAWVLAPTDELVLQLRRDLANALRAAGRYADSDQLTAQLVAQVQADRAYGEDHSIALDLARSRGHDLRIAGEYEQACELDRKTYARHLDKYEDVDDDRTAASRYNLAVSLRVVGRFAESEAIDRADLDRMRHPLDFGERRARRTINALAEDLYGLGRYSELLVLLAPVLEGRAGGHPASRWMLRARRTAALAQRRLGLVAAAVEQVSACYHACVVHLGEDRELTLATAMSYGNALRELGQWDTALHHAQRAQRGYERVMHADNPLIHAARTNVAAVLHGLDRHAEAKTLTSDAYRALSRLLGDRHPFTIAAAVNLATALAAAGQRPDARQMSARAWEDARVTFGENHPDTLIAAANFATDRAAIGPGDDAGPARDDVLSRLRRALGPAHPLVIRIAGGGRASTDVEPPSA